MCPNELTWTHIATMLALANDPTCQRWDASTVFQMRMDLKAALEQVRGVVSIVVVVVLVYIVVVYSSSSSIVVLV